MMMAAAAIIGTIGVLDSRVKGAVANAIGINPKPAREEMTRSLFNDQLLGDALAVFGVANIRPSKPRFTRRSEKVSPDDDKNPFLRVSLNLEASRVN